MAIKNDWPTAFKIGGVILLIIVLGKCNFSDVTEDPHANKSSMAQIQCKEFVSRRLKAPSSADFATYYDSQVSKPDENQQRYVVNSYVDAQNSFGAKIRSRFTCVARWSGKNSADISNWTLEDLNIF